MYINIDELSNILCPSTKEWNFVSSFSLDEYSAFRKNCNTIFTSWQNVSTAVFHAYTLAIAYIDYC